MLTENDLRSILCRIDGRGYRAYKDLQGAYDFAGVTLFVDHVQGDPYAAPSKVRMRVRKSVAQIPEALHRNAIRRVALEDCLARTVRDAIRAVARSRQIGNVPHSYGRYGSGKSGLITIDAGGQEVLERTAVRVSPDWVEARLEVGLPAAGRTILGREAERIFCDDLPRIVSQGLLWKNLPKDDVIRFVECVENQASIRDRLQAMGLVAFVADGAILPRASGVNDRPMARDDAVAFVSPEAFRVTVPLVNPIERDSRRLEELTGMGIPKGVTLIVGGGYHGKSCLLRAIERGVYDHVPGDGREYAVTADDAVKIRAEDGRRAECVDISGFIGDLPQGRETTLFRTGDASGSTSQAASILEALEVGATVLLLDEDTSATNFMVRDARMQALIAKDHEPITPFVDRVRELYETMGVSTILVMGGCGDYLDVAETVIAMREYLPLDVTEEAAAVGRSLDTQRRKEVTTPLSLDARRIPLAESFDPSRGRRDVKIDAKALDLILFGSEPIDLRGVEQLVDMSQTRAIGHAIHLATSRFMDGEIPLAEVVDRVEEFLDENGLDVLDPFHRQECHPGNYARPRRYEIAAAINRLRSVRMRQAR